MPVRESARDRAVTAIREAAEVQWVPNGMRHSYITYRVALLDSVERVAMEAGNSPDMVFRHYRSLATRAAAERYFAWRAASPSQQSLCPATH